MRVRSVSAWSSTGEPLAAIFGAIGAQSALALYPAVGNLVPQGVNRLERKVTPVDLDNDASLGVVDDELAVFHVITQWRHAAHPHALFLGGGDLVADAFAGDFPLELGEGQKDIQGQPSHAGGGVELLGDRHERDAAAVEDIDELGKIGERARQPVDLIDDDHIDLACLDVGNQPFQGWPLHRAAGKPAIIIERRQHRPAFALLRENEGGAGFPLGVERVEGLLQPLLR